MSQAKTLTPAELEQVLSYIEKQNFALRNRVMLLTGMWSGMSVFKWFETDGLIS
jgi:integrase